MKVIKVIFRALVIVAVVFGVPILLAYGMNWCIFKFVPGSNGDWFSFLGGYVGAIITIGGVYWQVRKQTVADKEADFRAARPLFLISINNEGYRENQIIYGNPKEELLPRTVTSYSYRTYRRIEIKNISKRLMSALKIEIVWKNTDKDTISISSVEPLKEIKIVDKLSLEVMTHEDDDNFDEYLEKENKKSFEKIDYVNVYFCTELREKIKLVFINDNGILKYDSKHLENKNGRIKEYNLDNFHESLSVKTN